MAQEHAGPPQRAPWTRVFTAFKVAFDFKKLLLAAVGIFAMALGWLVLSWVFYKIRGEPQWKDFAGDDNVSKEVREANWRRFKARRESFNLLHELAGAPGDYRAIDAADVSANHDEFKILDEWEKGYRRNSERVRVTNARGKEATLELPQAPKLSATIVAVDPDAETRLPVLAKAEGLTVRDLRIVKVREGEKTSGFVEISGAKYAVTSSFAELEAYRDSVLDLDKIEREAILKQKTAALTKFRAELLTPRYKPAGKLRVMPWWEDRGENPYLLVKDSIADRDKVWTTRGTFLNWLFTEEIPIVLEPLYKMLMPVVYFFDPRAGWTDRLYLLLILTWTLLVWGFFGGAICRIAAVQVARNERIPLSEAISFTRERFASYVAAPLFPMILIGVFMFLLMIFGWFEWIPIFGDIIVAGLFWPVVILIGLIMAIVLVGMIGWPLMIATISTEGSDSFDALSRSYSYVYQAPWQYLWYNFLAVVYGAVLIFFIGLMASLMIFLGKWGVSSAVGPASEDPAWDRDPAFLFYYAPTSFGWRDLLISGNQHVVPRPARGPSEPPLTRAEGRLQFTPEHEANMKWYNHTGAAMVAFWLYPLFLLVVGFGYSYFWSVSTIIYFLMRHHVDDTDMDEVHMEDEELEDPFMKPATPPPAAPAAPTKPGTVSLNVVDAPPASPAPPPMSPGSTSITASEPPGPSAPIPPSPQNEPPSGSS